MLYLTPPLINRVHNMDALELMRLLPAGSVDAIITDLPYGTTACSWDSIIPFAPMWAGVKRILKPRGVFVTTASQPFTSKLVMSNIDWFKYEWVWVKSLAFDFFNAKNKPMKRHENIVVFSPGTTANCSPNRMTYNAQGVIEVNKRWKRPRQYGSKHNIDRPGHSLDRVITAENYPDSVLEFPNGNNNNEHPTQKPAALYEYLIKTYTQPGDLILDFCAGSGTTGVAAQHLERRFILGDTSPEYCAIAEKRLAQPYTLDMFIHLDQMAAVGN